MIDKINFFNSTTVMASVVHLLKTSLWQKKYSTRIALLLILVLFISKINLCRETDKEKLGANEARIQAYLKSDNVIAVNLKLAPNSHVYLDRGSRGNLIPIEFDWQSLVKEDVLKKEPNLLSAPTGEYEKKVEASVLRKEGSFLFNVPNKQDLIGKEIRVRTQICDEIQNICYRPQWNNVRIEKIGKTDS